MDTYIIQAKCIFSNYTDVFKVNADSATDAIEVGKNMYLGQLYCADATSIGVEVLE